MLAASLPPGSEVDIKMQISPEVDKLRQALSTARSVLLTGPLDPDGDSIGACMALGRAVRVLGKANVTIAGTANYRYDWMPGAEALLTDAQITPDYDLVVILDGVGQGDTAPEDG